MRRSLFLETSSTSTTNNMRTLLLLLLSLMTCTEAMSIVKGCLKGWVEFSCKYPSLNKDINIEVINQTHSSIKTNKINVWENRDRLSLYSDTKNKEVKVVIKQLQRWDAREWKCKCIPSHSSQISTKLELESTEDLCQKKFDQTAYRAAPTTITCEYPKIQYKEDAFFCKESSSTCEEIPSGTSLQSNQKFSITTTNYGFNVSISDVSEEHKGVYWCGLKRKAGDYRIGVRKIELKVENISSFRRSAPVGGTLNYFCKSQQPEIFICRGEDPSLCQHLISTTGQYTEDGRFLIRRNKSNYFNITLMGVQYNDSGMYWCGAKGRFFHRMTFTVVPVPSTPVAVTKSTPAPSGSHGRPLAYILGITGAVLLLLLLMLVSFLIYKCLSKSRTRRNEASMSNFNEDYVYEEIQERVLNPDSNAVAKTIYATLDHPTNSSAALYYASISFQQSPNSARAQGLVLKPSSSTCEYSSVKTSQSPAVSHRSGPSGEPLYSTVNKKL